MKKFLTGLAASLALLVAGVPALAQGQNGRGAGLPRVSVSYYKITPGQQDEWLALYKKFHRPIMDYEISKGAVTSSTLYAAGNHAIEPNWDFAIINVAPPADKAPKLDVTRPELIRKLFPDLDAYVKGEKQRWTLTQVHWDESFVQMDINQNPLSVYYPVGGDKK